MLFTDHFLYSLKYTHVVPAMNSWKNFSLEQKKIRCLLTLLRAGMTCFNHSTFKPINRWAILVFSALTSDFSSGGVHSYCPLYVNLCYDIASFAISVQLMLKNYKMNWKCSIYVLLGVRLKKTGNLHYVLLRHKASNATYPIIFSTENWNVVRNEARN